MGNAWAACDSTLSCAAIMLILFLIGIGIVHAHWKLMWVLLCLKLLAIALAIIIVNVARAMCRGTTESTLHGWQALDGFDQ